jgi:hypothetical protein
MKGPAEQNDGQSEIVGHHLSMEGTRGLEAGTPGGTQQPEQRVRADLLEHDRARAAARDLLDQAPAFGDLFCRARKVIEGGVVAELRVLADRELGPVTGDREAERGVVDRRAQLGVGDDIGDAFALVVHASTVGQTRAVVLGGAQGHRWGTFPRLVVQELFVVRARRCVGDPDWRESCMQPRRRARTAHRVSGSSALARERWSTGTRGRPGRIRRGLGRLRRLGRPPRRCRRARGRSRSRRSPRTTVARPGTRPPWTRPGPAANLSRLSRVVTAAGPGGNTTRYLTSL